MDLKTGGNGPRVWGGTYLNYQGAKLNTGGEVWLVVMAPDGHLYRYPEKDTQYCKQGMGEPMFGVGPEGGSLLLEALSQRRCELPVCTIGSSC